MLKKKHTLIAPLTVEIAIKEIPQCQK